MNNVFIRQDGWVQTNVPIPDALSKHTHLVRIEDSYNEIISPKEQDISMPPYFRRNYRKVGEYYNVILWIEV